MVKKLKYLKIFQIIRCIFEPQLNAFKELVDKTKNFKEIIVYNVGLGSLKSEKFLFVDKENDGQSASIYKPKISSRYFSGISFENKEKISIETFDSFNLEVDLISIDIQGSRVRCFNRFQKLFEIYKMPCCRSFKRRALRKSTISKRHRCLFI